MKPPGAPLQRGCENADKARDRDAREDRGGHDREEEEHGPHHGVKAGPGGPLDATAGVEMGGLWRSEKAPRKHVRGAQHEEQLT